MDRLGPLHHCHIDTPYPSGGLYERNAPEWNQVIKPKLEVGSVVARCDSNVDITKRKYFAVIEIAPEQKFLLKVICLDGTDTILYEQVFD